MGAEATTLRVRRVGLAVVAGADAVLMAGLALTKAYGKDRFVGEAVPFFALARTPAVVLAAAAATIAITVWFARSSARILPGIVLLLSLRLQHELVGAAMGIFNEVFYHAGAALLGWTLGTLAARGAGADPARGEGERRYIERIAATGAFAMLAATWVSAGVCKLRASSLDWASGDTLRLLVVIHARPGHDGWRASFAEHLIASPRLAFALTVGALVIEAGAFVLLFGRRARALWSLLIIGFHVGTLLLAGIFFAEAVALLLLLGVPWGKLLRARGDDDARWTPDPARERRASAWVAGLTVAVCAGVWLLPVPRREHPLIRGFMARTAAMAAAAPKGDPGIARLGPIAPGLELAQGFRVHAIHVRERVAILEARDGGGRALEFGVAPPGVDGPRGPFDTGKASMWVRETELSSEVYEPVGRALVDAIRKDAGDRDPGDALVSWMAAAAR